MRPTPWVHDDDDDDNADGRGGGRSAGDGGHEHRGGTDSASTGGSPAPSPQPEPPLDSQSLHETTAHGSGRCLDEAIANDGGEFEGSDDATAGGGEVERSNATAGDGDGDGGAPPLTPTPSPAAAAPPEESSAEFKPCWAETSCLAEESPWEDRALAKCYGLLRELLRDDAEPFAVVRAADAYYRHWRPRGAVRLVSPAAS